MRKYIFEKNTRTGNPEVQARRKKTELFQADIPTPFQLLFVFKALLRFFTERDCRWTGQY